MNSLNFTVVIPALNPDNRLLSLVNELVQQSCPDIIVVNDGSRPECAEFFDQLKTIPQVTVLSHAINLGKGAALKTAFNHYLCRPKLREGLVTADADGQHQVSDIIKVGKRLMRNPTSLIIGCRQLPKDIPLRSYFGNTLTRYVFWMTVGQKVHDTQSGLRALPNLFLPFLLKRRSQGYEFELDMLILARSQGVKVEQEPIETIYIDENKISHFNPLRDSMRIYFVFIRFMASSVMTALVDFIVFSICIYFMFGIGSATALARTVAGTLNFATNKSLVFRSNAALMQSLVKYIGLVAGFGYLSFNLVGLFVASTGLNVHVSKLIAEALLFFLSFALQRDFVFKGRRSTEMAGKSTDWDAYYSKPFKSAKLTRKITEKTLVNIMKSHSKNNPSSVSIAELGGANSCFYTSVQDNIRPQKYVVFDNNQLGLEAFRRRIGPTHTVEMIQKDLLNEGIPERYQNQFDIVYSVGLIEHFDEQGTAKIIEAHTKLLKPGGLLLITFPTPTWLYRFTRGLAEFFGVWIFHDERPLRFEEVFKSLPQNLHLIYQKILWPLFLTQGVVALENSQK